MIGRAFLGVGNNRAVRAVAVHNPITEHLVGRFIAGDTEPDAVAAARDLTGEGLRVTIDRLGEDVTDRAEATRTRDAYLALLTGLDAAGLADRVEVSVKLSAVGQALPLGGVGIALDNAAAICAAAEAVGTTVTLDMEDHTTTDSTLSMLRDLRATYPRTGAVLQAYLRRTEADCRDLAYAGSRVRLCKGAYREPESVAFVDSAEVDKAYVRAMRVLIEGAGYPMLATHDQRLIDIAYALVVRAGRATETYEFQMLFGVRTDEQKRLAHDGHQVRVYVPYGSEWYGYLLRRIAERPANLVLLGRAALSGA